MRDVLLSASAETKRIADSVAAVNKPKQDAYNKQKMLTILHLKSIRKKNLITTRNLKR